MSAAEVHGCDRWEECALPAGHEPPCFDPFGNEPEGNPPPKVEIVSMTVTHDDNPAVPALPSRDAAIDAAARAALEEPGIPGRDEVLSLALQARLFAGSDLAPEAIRGKPYNAWLMLMVGRAVGIDPTAALRKVYVVDGQPTLAPQLTAALVRRQGLGSIRPHPDNNDTWAAAVALDPTGREMGMTVFTWEDAQIAGLVDPTCSAVEHNVREITRYRRGGGSYKVTGCECKANWRNYPRRMLWWRAVGYCADDYFPEVSMGLYRPDELGAMTDENGEPVDPETIELPQGYEQDGDNARGSSQPPEERVDPAELWTLQERIYALPAGLRDELRARWGENPRLGRARPASLDAGQARMASALISGFESRARSGVGWDPDAALADVRTAVAHRITSLLCPAPQSTDQPPAAPSSPDPGTDDGSEPEPGNGPVAADSGPDDGDG